MAKNLPYFRFTVQEWQNGDISTMPDSCKGVFVDICAYYWVKDCDVSEKKLLEKFKTKTKTIQKLIKMQVIKVQNGIVFISFLNEQLTELEQNKSFFSEMGKLGQKVKKSKAPLKKETSPPLSYKDKDKEKDNIYRRKQTLKESIIPFKEKYSSDMLNQFFLYWTEPNKSGTKMRWELEKTWDIDRRLQRWAANDYSKTPTEPSKPVEYYKPPEINEPLAEPGDLEKLAKEMRKIG